MVEVERTRDISTDGRVDKAVGSQSFNFSGIDEVACFESRARQKRILIQRKQSLTTTSFIQLIKNEIEGLPRI
ncbi:hypothetical protein Y032_0008g49 [Ancylostoma ceylanicum]|uniref:Uncharacterized protein n=1 Tax=Ancylostoma ceylanicum TaxID=53326 RepID=A0A016VKS9_9BILA|nr:hypothetical protein Y032_0008g49 [Ancylostoma ceylanicum]